MRIFIIMLVSIGMAFNASAQFGVHAGVVGTGIHSSEFGVDHDFGTWGWSSGVRLVVKFQKSLD